MKRAHKRKPAATAGDEAAAAEREHRAQQAIDDEVARQVRRDERNLPSTIVQGITPSWVGVDLAPGPDQSAYVLTGDIGTFMTKGLRAQSEIDRILAGLTLGEGDTTAGCSSDAAPPIVDCENQPTTVLPDDAEPAYKRKPIRPADYGMTPSAIAAVMAHARAQAAGRTRPARRSLEQEWNEAGRYLREIAEPGKGNAGYKKRADALLGIAMEGEQAREYEEAIATLEEHTINGVNTYARALRAYRDGLIRRLSAEEEA